MTEITLVLFLAKYFFFKKHCIPVESIRYKHAFNFKRLRDRDESTNFNQLFFVFIARFCRSFSKWFVQTLGCCYFYIDLRRPLAVEDARYRLIVMLASL